MIARKLKPCKTCGDPRYIFSHGNCKDCATALKLVEKPTFKHPKLKQTDSEPAKPLKYQTKVIKKVSTRQQKLNALYKLARDLFMRQHPDCMAQLPGCTGASADLHHIRSRGEYLLDTRYFMATCRSCHDHIHTHHSESVARGFIQSKLAKVI